MVSAQDKEKSPGRVLTRHAIVFAIYLGLTCLMTLPVCLRLSSHIPGAGDPLLTLWYLDRNMERYIQFDFDEFYDAQLLYPYADTAAYSEHFIGTSFLALPLKWICGGDLIAVYNLIFLLSFAFCGYAMHLLARDLTGRDDAAFVSAVIFTFVPFRIDHIVHLHMVTAGWVPLAIFFLMRYLRTGTRLQLAGFALCFLINALSSCFYMVALSLLLLILFPFMAWSARARWRRILVELSSAMVLVALVLLAVYKPYLDVQATMGFERDPRENVLYSARWDSWLGVPGWQARNLIYGEHALNFERFTRPECALFPGFIAIFGLIGWIAQAIRTRQIQLLQVGFLTLMFFGFVLSAGPFLNHNPDLPNPVFNLVFDYFPGASSMRTPARYSFFVFTGLAITGGLFAAGVSRRRWVYSAGMAGIALLEYVSIPLYTDPIEHLSSPPEHIEMIQEQDSEAVILEYPLGSDVLNRDVTFSATSHELRMVNGYTSYYPPAHSALMESADAVMNEDQLTLLEQLGVTHVVASHQHMDGPSRRLLRDMAEAYPGRLQSGGTIGMRDVYRLPATAPAAQLTARRDAVARQGMLDLPTSVPAGDDTLLSGRIMFPGNPTFVSSVVLPAYRSASLILEDEQGRTVIEKVRLESTRHEPAASFTFRAPSDNGRYRATIRFRKGVLSDYTFTNVRGIASAHEGSRCHVEIPDDAIQVERSSVVLLRVLVRNTGETYWRREGVDGKGPVRIGYHIYRGERLMQDLRASLPRDLAPGDEAEAVLEFRAPVGASDYKIRVDVLAEEIRWFSDPDKVTEVAMEVVEPDAL